MVSNITAGSDLQVYCVFPHNNGSCTPSGPPARSCSCNPDTGEYTVNITVAAWNGEVWKVTIHPSTNTQVFEQVVNLQSNGRPEF